MDNAPDITAIREAHDRIKQYIHRTPVLTCQSINTLSGASVFFKCENFQKGGAFKFRGACNTVLSLNEREAAHGVLTHSSGNHAAALSLAARIRDIPAYIVMPSTAPAVKKAAVENYGGRITYCEPTLASREAAARKLASETGAALVHPYDDYRIITGAATAALEFLEDVHDLDYLLAPVGGGGLISGSALTTSFLSPNTKVIACEPENADDAYRSFHEGRIVPIDYPETVADGLRTMLSEKTFGIIKQYVHDIITVTEEEIVLAMRTVWERMKIIIEPSSAVAVAPVLFGKISVRGGSASGRKIDGKRVGVILSGGNVDLQHLP